MSQDAGWGMKELKAVRHRDILRNVVMIVCMVAAVFAGGVAWWVVQDREAATEGYVREAQETVRETCDAAKEVSLPANTKRDCEAAERNELPQVIQSVVDNPDPDDAEKQDPEVQNSEVQDPETQEPENQESEVQDPDNQEIEIQESEIQEEEVQDPEIDDQPIPGPGGQQGKQGEQGERGEPGPTCQPGYSAQERFIEGNPMTTEDDETWLVCVKDSP